MTADRTAPFSLRTFVLGGPIRWLTLGGILLIAAITIGTTIMVDSFRERALNNSTRELQNTVLLLARHFDRQIGDFTAVEKDIASQIELSGFASPDIFRGQMATLEMHEMLRAKVSGTSDAAGVNIFDSRGVLINSSETWPVPDVNIADRGFFKAFRSGAAATPVLVELMRSSANWETVIARRLAGPNGEFLGLVTRAIAPATLETFLASMALGQDAAISVHHRDGTLLARYPHVETMIGRNFKTGPMRQQRLFELESDSTRSISPIDGQERLISARSLDRLPLSIIATTTVWAALADWRQQTRFLIAVAGLSVLVIAVILLLVIRKLAQQHRLSQQQLTLEKQRLDTAVNNIPQGLILYDTSARITVCNRRYIDMFGLSPEVAKPGCSMQDLIAHRKATVRSMAMSSNSAPTSSAMLHLEKSPTRSPRLPAAGRSRSSTSRSMSAGGLR